MARFSTVQSSAPRRRTWRNSRRTVTSGSAAPRPDPAERPNLLNGVESVSTWNLHRFPDNLGPLVRYVPISGNALAIAKQIPGVSGGKEVSAFRGFDPPFAGFGVVLLNSLAVGIHHC